MLDIPEDAVMKCTLSTFMGKRRLKIADVARGTGLHRNVVSSYYHDEIKRYDRDVMTALCKYLGVPPGELLVLELPDPPPAQ